MSSSFPTRRLVLFRPLTGQGKSLSVPPFPLCATPSAIRPVRCPARPQPASPPRIAAPTSSLPRIMYHSIYQSLHTFTLVRISPDLSSSSRPPFEVVVRHSHSLNRGRGPWYQFPDFRVHDCSTPRGTTYLHPDLLLFDFRQTHFMVSGKLSESASCESPGYRH